MAWILVAGAWPISGSCSRFSLTWLAPLPEWARVGVSIALLAPLGIPMGMLFPRGIAWVAARSERLIPWVWAINGCASVVSAILAVVLAMHFGFNVVLFLALLLYATAAYYRAQHLWITRENQRSAYREGTPAIDTGSAHRGATHERHGRRSWFLVPARRSKPSSMAKTTACWSSLDPVRSTTSMPRASMRKSSSRLRTESPSVCSSSCACTSRNRVR